MFSTSGHPLVIAHRGASGHAVENSLEAFRKADELRADGVELDVHATSDGTIIVFHDACLPSGESISETPAARIREHRLANGEPVPLLSEVLAAIPELKVFIEVKQLDSRWDGALLRVIAAGNPERCAVHSFDHRVVARLAALRPTLACGVLSVARLVDPVHALDRALADTLWQEAEHVDPALVQQVHDSNRRVFAWTINEADTAHRLTQMGVDGLCGNFPERLSPSRR
ncbi:MAG TPA: glycerophosphodiester phosphodiesterase [Gemmatimonadales bacterium]|nr:glycerophosphodiester phosphodiesterase [Gemmatimonadales bacterium]